MIELFLILYFTGVTGNALPADIDTFVARGADEVITKPLTKAKLIEALSRYSHPMA